MTYRKLGPSNLKVSEISLGTHLTIGQTLPLATAETCVRTALDLGINLFDTADTYGYGKAEETLGHILGAVNRETFIVTTKCFFPMSDDPGDKGLSRHHIFNPHSPYRTPRVLVWIDVNYYN